MSSTGAPAGNSDRSARAFYLFSETDFAPLSEKHNDYFLNQNYYAKETSEQIQAAITAFLGQ